MNSMLGTAHTLHYSLRMILGLSPYPYRVGSHRICRILPLIAAVFAWCRAEAQIVSGSDDPVTSAQEAGKKPAFTILATTKRELPDRKITTHHVRIVVGDVNDLELDSGLFLKAEMVDVHFKTISSIERGRYPFAVTTFVRIAQRLGTSLDLLAEGVPDEADESTRRTAKALQRKRRHSSPGPRD